MEVLLAIGPARRSSRPLGRSALLWAALDCLLSALLWAAAAEPVWAGLGCFGLLWAVLGCSGLLWAAWAAPGCFFAWMR